MKLVDISNAKFKVGGGGAWLENYAHVSIPRFAYGV
jgi:hypothetical protein